MLNSTPSGKYDLPGGPSNRIPTFLRCAEAPTYQGPACGSAFVEAGARSFRTSAVWSHARVICRVLALAVCAVLPATAHSQTPPASGDRQAVVLDVDEGIFRYLMGSPSDVASYRRAIELFSSALEKDPNDQVGLAATAHLFRALSYGELGEVEDRGVAAVSDELLRLERVLRFRDAGGIAAVEDRANTIEARLQNADEPPTAADRLELEDELADLRKLLDTRDEPGYWSDAEGQKAKASLEALETNRKNELIEAWRRQRVLYRAMADDLAELTDRLENPENAIRLAQVVASAKVANLDQMEAATAIELGRAPDPKLRGEARALLGETADMLESLRQTGVLDDTTRVRTDFFLGVIRYRQAVERKAAGERLAMGGAEFEHLRQARALMEQVASSGDEALIPGDPTQGRKWRSYANLYLGLILPFQTLEKAPDDPESMRLLDRAEQSLSRAVELDVTEEGESFSGGIPLLVRRQREQIGRWREAGPTRVEGRIHDLRLTLGMGGHRDTNVLLLGERTDLPRGVADVEDFGLTASATIDYTLDLGVVNDKLDAWTLGLRAHTDQIWHTSVDEFDQQSYGGSVALQYEVLPPGEDFGPLYFHIQYDFDYVLLGRSGFLTSNTLTPSIRAYCRNGRIISDFYFRYEIQDYSEPLFDRRFNRDGVYPAIGLTETFKLTDMTAVYDRMGWTSWGHANDAILAESLPDGAQRPLTVFGGFEYSWDATRGDEFDLKAYQLLTGLRWPLPWGLDLDGTATFEWENYQHGSLVDFHRRGRRDFIQYYELALSRMFLLRGGGAPSYLDPDFKQTMMTLRAHARWTLDDSNTVDRLGQSIFEYDRVVYGISVAFSFN